MATLTPAAVVTGAPRQPLPFGLFSVLAPRSAEAITRWEGGGVTWEYLPGAAGLGVLGPVQGRNADGSQPEHQAEGLPKTLEAREESFGDATPFTVYGHWSGSLMSRSFEEAQAGAIENLTTFEERQVEAALWNGYARPTLSGGAGLGTFEATEAKQWVPVLEDYLADTYGSLGVLHMGRLTATVALQEGALEKDRNRLVTKMGTPVVAGAGYDDSHVRATPALFGYRSEAFTSSNRRGDLYTPGTNDLTAIAERSYLIGFDPTGVGDITVN